MFERRLKILLLLMAAPVAALMARLVVLQGAQAGYYQQQAERLLVRPPRYTACLRGEITDNQGRRLAYDAPSWDLCVDYPVIQRTVTQRDSLDEEVETSWEEIARFTDVPMGELEWRCGRIVRMVSAMHESVSKRRGVDTVVAEEKMAHPLVKGLTQEQQALARVRFARYPWIEIVGSHTRRYAGGEAIGQLVGRLGEVDDKAIAAQQEAARDEDATEFALRRYLPGDLHGISGVERLAENWLRGRRGRTQEDIEGRPLITPVLPQNGRDCRLTIDLPLQQALYNRLAAAVQTNSLGSTGGCVVVLDIPSRQILAMVSYPSVDPNASAEDRMAAEEDTVRVPFVLRPIGEYYQQGSIVKPMMMAAALTDRVTEHPVRPIHCYGRLFPDLPNRWGCLGVHGAIDPVGAIQRSCNVFFYVVGETMGVERLSWWLTQFGYGEPTGTGLAEEKPGLLPRTTGRGVARLAGIGQGELTVTPLQTANMIATIATGVWRPVSLWAERTDPRPARKLPISETVWRTVREGMYRVVNVEHGSAYGRATLTDEGPYVLLGKTGSAQAWSRAVDWTYICEFPDGSRRELVARNIRELHQRYPEVRQARVAGRRAHTVFPPRDTDPTHAWFAGYLTRKDRYLEPGTGGDLNVAIVVMLEYGGRGGLQAAPVARDMVHSIILRQKGITSIEALTAPVREEETP